MRSQLVRRVMNNISSKNMDRIPREHASNREQDCALNNYELQKKISLSNYSSAKDLDHNKRDRRDRKPIDLNSLADEVRGSIKSDDQVRQLEEVKDKNKEQDKKRNILTLGELSRISGGKGGESKDYKPLGDSSHKNKNTSKNKGLSLEELADNVKKNI